MNLHIISSSASIKYGHGKEYVENIVNRLSSLNNREKYFDSILFYTDNLNEKISLDNRVELIETKSNITIDKSENIKKWKSFWRFFYGIQRIRFYNKLYDAVIDNAEANDKVYFLEFEYISLFLNKKIRKMNPVVTLHTMDFKKNEYSIVESFYKGISGKANKSVFKDASKIIVHGDLIKKVFCKSYQKYCCKVYTAYYGIEDNPVSLKQTEAKSFIKDKYGIDLSNSRNMLIFGLLRRNKGILEFIEKLPKQISEYSVLIVGKNYDIDKKSIKEKLNDRNDIYWVDEYVPEEEIKYFFSASDWLILPYLKNMNSQSGPLKIAMSYKIPVLASKYGEIGDFVNNYDVGITFDPYNKQEILRIIDISKENNKENYVKNIEKLKNKMSWNKMALKIWNTLKESCS